MNSHGRLPRTSARWLLSTALAGASVGLVTPALLHAQAAHPTSTANQPTPAPPNPATPPPQVATTPAPPPTTAAAQALELGRAFTDVSEHVLPSVVSIRVEAEADMSEGQGFFMPFGGDVPSNPIVHGEGSGIIVRDDGVILTNNHVVERARRLSVHLHDGRVYRARVLGTDPATDLALIKIDATGLPAARLGDSDQARVGEFVLAIGAPLGLEATVTHGVVSATGRGGLGASEIEDYLQTDASINPGNSGGPLVNLRGEVLGINTMIVGRNTGIGMAIPSRMAQTVIEQILRTGHVSRGWIGVGVQDLTQDLAENMGLRADVHGAIVNQVEPGAPAARAGLEIGDVVTSVDGRPVTTSMDVVRAVTRHGVNDRVALDVLRDGRSRVMAVTTAARPAPENANGSGEGEPQEVMPHTQGLGLRLATMSPELAARLGTPNDGLVVASVEPGSAADEAGLHRGDVILRADGHAVHSVNDVLHATADRRVTFLVRRGHSQIFVPVQLD